MKKKMIHLFLIIVCLGSLFLASGWYEYQQNSTTPQMDRAIAQLAPQMAPQTMTHFLKSNF